MAKSAYKGPERRKYMRLEADCAVNYVKLSSDLKPVNGFVENSFSENISGGGIKFASKESCAVGTILELQFKIPPMKEFITAIGKVVRVDKMDKNNYEIAIAFIWIKDNDITSIDDYVKRKELERIQSELRDMK
mgnify:CR=1 FL=1